MKPKATSPAPGVERLAGGLLVLALHAAALWGLFSHRLITLPVPTPTVFVGLVAPPASDQARPVPATPSKPRREEPMRPGPMPLSATAPASSEAPTATAAPPPSAIALAPAPTPAVPLGPVRLVAELAVSCPERHAPDYPLASRRRNEAGTSLLEVDLDETGLVVAATILESSGFPRLDEAALVAVRRWRCNPPHRNGQPVRATARQALKFVLQGN